MITDVVIEKTVDNLKKNNFTVYVAETKEEGAQIVCSLIEKDATIGVGGSATIDQLNILDDLDAKGHLIFNHNKPGISLQQLLDFRRRQLLCDVFLTSTNALTETGELVNIDGFGNRVAALSFGPKRVVVAAGINKIVPDVESGIKRVKNIAAPMNAKRLFEVGRLKKAPPCVKTGHCVDCRGPERICTITTVTNRRPFLTDIHIVLIKEELGF